MSTKTTKDTNSARTPFDKVSFQLPNNILKIVASRAYALSLIMNMKYTVGKVIY